MWGHLLQYGATYQRPQPSRKMTPHQKPSSVNNTSAWGGALWGLSTSMDLHGPSSSWLTWSCVDLVRVTAPSVSSWWHQSHQVPKTLFYSGPPWLLRSCCCLFSGHPELRWWGYYRDVLFVAKSFTLWLVLCIFTSCEFLCVPLSTTQRSSFDKVWDLYELMGMAKGALRAICHSVHLAK